MRFFLPAAILLGLGCLTKVSGQSVLIYDGSFDGYAVTAATNLGYDVTVTTDETSFSDELFGGTVWDLLILDQPDLGDDVASLVGSFISDDDGQAILAMAALDATQTYAEQLRLAFQISDTIDVITPLDLFSWDTTHPIWTTPNPVTSPLAWMTDTVGDDGDRLTGFSSTEVVGGFVDIETAGEGGIVIGNSGRTICNGFIYDNYPVEIVGLLENQMAFILGASPPVDDDFVRGDANQDGSFDIADAVATLTFLFVPGTAPPACLDAADSNDDGTNDISDGIYSLSALFVAGSPQPPMPIGACGLDPTADSLGCGAFSACP